MPWFRRDRPTPAIGGPASGRSPWRLRHPAQFVAAAFFGAIIVGTALLLLPFAREDAGSAPFVTALFTATSAVCVTGLIVVDTATYWSTFGEVTLLVLIQISGFGIMTLASLLALFVYRNLGLWGRLIAQAETKTFSLGDVRRVLYGVAFFSILFEGVTAAVFAFRLVTGHGETLGRAIYQGVFHGISAFNNAGFSLYDDSMMGFVTDVPISLVVACAVIAGGLGFPVLLELRRHLVRPREWSLHTKITLGMTALLLPIGTLMILGFEWTNPDTLGPLSTPHKLLAGFFQGVTPRSGGLSTLDYSAMNEDTWLGTMILMFIGGGSAGTAGGVKVTTIALLGAMVWAEARGEPSVDLLHRRIPGDAQRQALSVVVAGAVVALSGTIAVLAVADSSLTTTLFEAFSAFGIVGLSLGLTPELPDSGRLILVALMFAGRVGPITLVAALALRQHRRLYKLPEERPIVG